MRHDQSPTDVTVAVLAGLRDVLRAEEPDWVLVQGDTTTTMAGGLGAFHHGCRVAHVEAGLRTFSRRGPRPGGGNRRRARLLPRLPFAATLRRAQNLFPGGVLEQNMFPTRHTGGA